jgi:hypothetical protein
MQAQSNTISLDAKSSNEKKKQQLYVDGFTGNDWGDKITFTVGISYFGGILL